MTLRNLRFLVGVTHTVWLPLTWLFSTYLDSAWSMHYFFAVPMFPVGLSVLWAAFDTPKQKRGE